MARARAHWWFRWALRALFSLVLILVVATGGLVLALRWIDPPTSAFMVLARRASPQARVEHQWVDWDRIPPHLAAAVVAAEDQRFLMHNGFDLYAIRDVLEEARAGARLRGASTISQQVAKNLFLWPARSYVRKGLEAYFTVFIELCWTKRRILEVYLNIVEFGPGVFGAGAASKRYFGRPADRLTESQAALLAAVLPSPHRFDLDDPSPTLNSRATRIIKQMRLLYGTRYLRRI
ncbi:MAG: monofunctional biosynthetic peptidoglycan transglycosylase [Gammaproteobacteria bacterium]|nr:monofunctional biosynthetic peptidoglycan transglycosylase [Gammaproteobacteria bacterium]